MTAQLTHVWTQILCFFTLKSITIANFWVTLTDGVPTAPSYRIGVVWKERAKLFNPTLCFHSQFIKDKTIFTLGLAQ